MKITITIDFGMTGSGNQRATPAKRVQVRENPTRIQYNNEGKVVVWGSACDAADAADDLFELFKSDYAKEVCPILQEQKKDSKIPSSIHNPGTLVSDYLHYFCSSILEKVTNEENLDLQKLEPEWHLTVPGCWSVPMRLGFKSLARGVILNLSPNSQVFAGMTEAETSTEFMLDYLQLQSNEWIIACDIGGATADTALATAGHKSHGVMHDLSPEVYPMAGQMNAQGGVCLIDDQMSSAITLHTRRVPFKKRFNLTRKIATSSEWQQARHSFEATKDAVMDFRQPLGATVDSPDISIHGSKVIIPKKTMELFFHEFLKLLYLDLDEAMRQYYEASEGGPAPSLIALSGGGGTIPHVVNQLKARYTGVEIKTPSSTKESSLATIVGHRLYLTRQALEKYCGQVYVGISDCSEREPVNWQECVSSCTAKFSSRKKTATHFFMVITKSLGHDNPNDNPKPFSVVSLKNGRSQWPGALIWPLHVTLGNHWLKGQKYSITATLTGINLFDFKAYNPEGTLELSVDDQLFGN